MGKLGEALRMIREGLAILEEHEAGEGDLDEGMDDADEAEHNLDQFKSPQAERFRSGKSARQTRSEGAKRAREINVEAED